MAKKVALQKHLFSRLFQTSARETQDYHVHNAAMQAKLSGDKNKPPTVWVKNVMFVAEVGTASTIVLGASTEPKPVNKRFDRKL